MPRPRRPSDRRDRGGNNDNGLRITSLTAITRAAVATACNCQLYKKVGSTYTLIASVVMATGTPSGSVANQTADFGYSDDNPLVLGRAWAWPWRSGRASRTGSCSVQVVGASKWSASIGSGVCRPVDGRPQAA